MSVKAKKGNQLTTFTDLIWRNMGKNHNGWVRVDALVETEKTGELPASVGADLDTEKKYKRFIEQGKGLVTDGNFQAAISKFAAAETLKPSSYIKGLIAKTRKAHIDALKAEEFEGYVEGGDKAFEEGDFAAALELFGHAKTLEATEYVLEMIGKAEEALEGQSENQPED